MKSKGVKLAALLAVLFFCPIAKAAAQGRLIIFGLDETGSYSLRTKAVAIARQAVEAMAPGDIFYARRITHASYLDNCTVLRLALPQVEAKPANRLDRRALLAWQARNRQLAQLKAQAGTVLARLKPVKAPKTDIWGFLAAAADRIRAEGVRGSETVILIASDMQDNCRRKVGLDLKGARVVVAGFETGVDPKAAQKTRSNWRKALEACQAGMVTFLPPDCGFELNAGPQATR